MIDVQDWEASDEDETGMEDKDLPALEKLAAGDPDVEVKNIGEPTLEDKSEDDLKVQDKGEPTLEDKSEDDLEVKDKGEPTLEDKSEDDLEVKDKGEPTLEDKSEDDLEEEDKGEPAFEDKSEDDLEEEDKGEPANKQGIDQEELAEVNDGEKERFENITTKQLKYQHFLLCCKKRNILC